MLCHQVPRHFPAEKLLPLTTPQRPWSHLTIDFLIDLPEYNGKTAVLVTTDRFSRLLKLITLSALHRALQTTEVLFQYVFRYLD